MLKAFTGSLRCLTGCGLLAFFLSGAASASEWQLQEWRKQNPAQSSADLPPSKVLGRAWEGMISDLNQARAALEDPWYYPAPASDRNLAEGYRYLMGHLHRIIEAELHQSPEHPYFQRQLSRVAAYTMGNADTQYLYAPIDAWGTYLVIGRAGPSKHWRGGKRPRKQDGLAPHYMVFETHTTEMGDSGRLDELNDGSHAVVSAIDSSKLEINGDGSFEILISPNKPAGYEGNYLPSSVLGEDGQQLRANKLYIHELFADWENESSPYLEIVKVGKAGEAPAPVTANDTARELRRLGQRVKHHTRFWNRLYANVLEAHGDLDGDGQTLMQNNCFGEPILINAGAEQSVASHYAAGGTFELAEDEALLIEMEAPDALYFSVQLANFWGMPLDFANRMTSLNHMQAHRSKDKNYRFVLSAKDPGVPNWLDTTGLDSGYLIMRSLWQDVPEVGVAPTVSCQRVSLMDLPAMLPETTPEITELARRKQIMLRQQHVARRYRQY